MIQCEGRIAVGKDQYRRCSRRAPQSDGRWAAVLSDEGGSTPRILCPTCADDIERGADPDADGGHRAFASTISRF